MPSGCKKPAVALSPPLRTNTTRNGGPPANCISVVNTSSDTREPYPAQYPLNFRLVNVTGVPVFRTRYVAQGAGWMLDSYECRSL
jgi:hypothetical protein